MKRIITIVLAVILVCGGISNVYADEQLELHDVQQEVVQKEVIEGNTEEIKNDELILEAQNLVCKTNNIIELSYKNDEKTDTKTLICNNSLYLPLRFISEKMGYTVEWLVETNSVIVKDNELNKIAEIDLNANKVVNFEETNYMKATDLSDIIRVKLNYNLENKVIELEKYLSLKEMKSFKDMQLYDYAKAILKVTEGSTIINMTDITEATEDKFYKFYVSLSEVAHGTMVTSPYVSASYSVIPYKDGLYNFTTITYLHKLIEDEQIELDNYVNDIIKKSNEYTNDIEKLKFINNEVVKHLRYDYNVKISELSEKNHPDTTAYGAVSTKKAVCSGYTELFTYIVNKLDIPVIKITGYDKRSNDYHIWNKVYIEKDGVLDWYNIDVTWNDTLNNPTKYFLINDKKETTYKRWNKEVEQTIIDIKYPEIKEREFINKILNI